MERSAAALGETLRRHPWAGIFLVAFSIRMAYLVACHGKPIAAWHLWPESDMYGFLRTADAIRRGDWLQREPFHHIVRWHLAIADAATWERWWGRTTFFQAPVYSYLLALLLGLSGGSLGLVKLVQAGLGAAAAALIGRAGDRLAGRPAGVLAGLLAALYGPFVAADSMLLREGPGIAAASFAFFLSLRALQWPSGDRTGSVRAWLEAGAALTLAVLVKEIHQVLFVSVLVLGLFQLARAPAEKRREQAAGLAGLMAGAALAFLPLLARNLAVGAAPFSSSCAGPIVFIFGNAIDAPGHGAVVGPPPSARGLMMAGDGRLFPTVWATFSAYRGQPLLLLVGWVTRVRAMFSDVEVGDNFSYRYMTLRTPLLGWLAHFSLVRLVGLLALLALLSRRSEERRGRALSAPEPMALRLILLTLGLHLLAQSFLDVVGRYRMVFVPYLMLLGGWVLAEGWRTARERQWRTFGALAGAAGVLALGSLFWPPDELLENGAVRSFDYVRAATILADQGDLPSARREIDDGIAYLRDLVPPQPGTGISRVELFLRGQRLHLFVSHGAVDQDPDDIAVLKALQPDNPFLKSLSAKGG